MNLGFVVAIGFIFCWHLLASEVIYTVEKGANTKQKGRRRCSSCLCDPDKALPYVQYVDSTLTRYIKEEAFDKAVQYYITPTATYAVTRFSYLTGCIKSEGCLIPSIFWGHQTQYDFLQIELIYQRNGVVVVRGNERIRHGTELIFEGEVYRYYMAECGCDYRLEMVLGTDRRCSAYCAPNAWPFPV